MYVPCVTHKFNAFAGTKATLTLHVAGALAVETCLSFGPWKPRSGPLRLDLKILHVMTILEPVGTFGRITTLQALRCPGDRMGCCGDGVTVAALTPRAPGRETLSPLHGRWLLRQTRQPDQVLLVALITRVTSDWMEGTIRRIVVPTVQAAG